MQKLTELRTFLTAINGVDENKIDVWPEAIELRLQGKHKGNGLALVEMRYTAVADIENWPHAKRPVQLLFAKVVAWLAETDTQRDTLDNKHVNAVTTIHDDQTADIELSIDFAETLEVVEDENGEIEAFDTRWSLSNVPIDIAETGDVETEGGAG